MRRTLREWIEWWVAEHYPERLNETRIGAEWERQLVHSDGNPGCREALFDSWQLPTPEWERMNGSWRCVEREGAWNGIHSYGPGVGTPLVTLRPLSVVEGVGALLRVKMIMLQLLSIAGRAVDMRVLGLGFQPLATPADTLVATKYASIKALQESTPARLRCSALSAAERMKVAIQREAVAPLAYVCQQLGPFVLAIGANAPLLGGKESRRRSERLAQLEVLKVPYCSSAEEYFCLCAEQSLFIYPDRIGKYYPYGESFVRFFETHLMELDASDPSDGAYFSKCFACLLRNLSYLFRLSSWQGQGVVDMGAFDPGRFAFLAQSAEDCWGMPEALAFGIALGWKELVPIAERVEQELHERVEFRQTAAVQLGAGIFRHPLYRDHALRMLHVCRDVLQERGLGEEGYLEGAFAVVRTGRGPADAVVDYFQYVRGNLRKFLERYSS